MTRPLDTPLAEQPPNSDARRAKATRNQSQLNPSMMTKINDVQEKEKAGQEKVREEDQKTEANTGGNVLK